jgi:hypothetical protein
MRVSDSSIISSEAETSATPNRINRGSLETDGDGTRQCGRARRFWSTIGEMKRAAVLACAVLAAAAHPAFACDCAPLKAPSAAIRTEAPYIFEGQVVEILDRSLHITRITPSDSTGETRPLGREVVFHVTRAWAGVSARRISLFVESSDCAFSFEAGHRYVVFARRGARGKPMTNLCMRTAESDRADPLIRALGPAKVVHRTKG